MTNRILIVSSPPSIIYTLLDGTLGIDHYEQQLVILPGAIVHLDCVFQESFGQPQWFVTDIPSYISSSSQFEDESTKTKENIDAHFNVVHHKVFDYLEEQQKQNPQQHIQTQQSMNYRRRKYQHKKYQQQHKGSNQNVKLVSVFYYQ